MMKNRGHISLSRVLGAAVGMLIGGCGSEDPILKRADELRAQGGPSATETPGPAVSERSTGSTGGQAPSEVQARPPDAPAPGTPDEPLPGEPSEPMPAAGQPVPPAQGEGPVAKISGTVKVPEGLTGRVHIVAFASDPKAARSGGGHPDVAGFIVLDEPGDFSVELANGGEPVWLDAHLDLGDEPDGRPGPGEPMGFWGEGIPTTEDTQDVILELLIRPHEGPPPPGEPPPPAPEE